MRIDGPLKNKMDDLKSQLIIIYVISSKNRIYDFQWNLCIAHFRVSAFFFFFLIAKVLRFHEHKHILLLSGYVY